MCLNKLFIVKWDWDASSFCFGWLKLNKTHRNTLQSLVFDVIFEMGLVLYRKLNLMFQLKAMIFLSIHVLADVVKQRILMFFLLVHLPYRKDNNYINFTTSLNDSNKSSSFVLLSKDIVCITKVELVKWTLLVKSTFWMKSWYDSSTTLFVWNNFA